MRIDVCRCVNVCVSEPFLYILNLIIKSNKQTCTTMSQIVKPYFP